PASRQPRTRIAARAVGKQRFRTGACSPGFHNGLLPELQETALNLDRDLLVMRLESDLVGPLSADEILENARPSDIYLTGILWPRHARMAEEEAERLDSAGSGGGDAAEEVDGAAEEVPLVGLQRPCSAGVSFALAAAGEIATISAQLTFALYRLVAPFGRADAARPPTCAAPPEDPSSGSVQPRPLRQRQAVN